MQLNGSATVGGIHNVNLSANFGQAGEEGVEIPTWSTGAAYSSELTSWLSLSPSVSTAGVIDYSTLVPAQSYAGDLTATLRPTVSLRLDLTARHQQLYPETGDPRLASIFRARVAWQFTRELGLRILEEHTSGTDRDDQLISSALLTWLLHPFTSAHVGYAETTLLGSGWDTQDRTVFAKASWWFRP